MPLRKPEKAIMNREKPEPLLGTEFESLLIKIIDSIFPVNKDDEIKEFFSKKPTEEEISSFLNESGKNYFRTINNGFKIAQHYIIDELLKIQSEQKKTKDLLKEARRKKNNDINVLKNELHLLAYKETTLKHLADTIFWHLIQGQLHIARRFYQYSPGCKKLEDTNYKTVLEIADKINTNPDNFVLLTDITNYVQIGDLFGIKDGKNVIIEVKEGEKNIKIMNDLDALSRSSMTFNSFLQKYENRPHELNQILRIIKQNKVAENEVDIINTDKGYDPVSNKKIHIITPKEETPYYYNELHQLEKQLCEQKDWAYTVIDNCLHIGLYKESWISLGKPVLEIIAKDQGINHKIIVDARSSMKTTDSPLLFLPFSKQLILDILMGRVIMYLMLDIDKYIKTYELFGAKCSWVSTKETQKIKEDFKKIPLYIEDHRTIRITNAHGVQSFMAMGTLSKILFNHIKPTYVAYSSNYYTKEELLNK